MPVRKALFIVNKFSGGGYRPEVEGRIIEQCKNSNIECRIEFTQGRGHATELAHDAIDQSFDFVFAVGGDGTVNEVAQGLLGSEVAMGILPKGSGNGLARHLGIPMSFKKALNIFQRPHEQLIDTMQVNGKLSVNVSGIGFDGHIAGLFENKEKRGLIGYSKLVLKEFLSFKEFEASIEVNGDIIKSSSFIIALANSSQFGNNARVAPQASVCDQLIDICLIKKVSAAHMAGFAGKMFTGSLNKSRFVEIQRAKHLNINLKERIAYHIDGEAMPATDRFEVILKPGSLKVVVLARSKWHMEKYPI